MLKNMTKFGLAAFTTIAFAGTAMADHHEEAMDDVSDAADDMMDDAGDMMDDASDSAGDMMDDASHDGDVHMADAAGSVLINAALQYGLNSGNSGQPISIAPDIWYQHDSKLRVGLVHSAYGSNGYWTQANALFPSSLCVSGDDDGCTGGIYSGGGLRALYEVSHSDSLALAADAGVNLTRFNDGTGGKLNSIGIRLGVKGAWNSGKLMVGFNPSVNIPATERDFREDYFLIPVDVGYMVTQQIWAGVQTGFNANFDNLGDTYSIPLNIGAMYMLNRQINVGAAFGFSNLLGKDNILFEKGDARSLSLMASYRL